MTLDTKMIDNIMESTHLDYLQNLENVIDGRTDYTDEQKVFYHYLLKTRIKHIVNPILDWEKR